METEISSLDSDWRPEPMKPRADTKIAEIITAERLADDGRGNRRGGWAVCFSSWKVKNVLKKRSTGPKAVFTLADGKYAVKPT